MRGRAIIPMVVGLGVGLVALKVFVNVLQKAKGATVESVPLVCAAMNIEPTIEVTESMIEVRQVSKEAFPETGFHDKKEVLGRVTSWPIPKGTPFGAMQLAPKGTPAGMAVRIENGLRAVAVKIDESAGVAGWIKPGSRVDVTALLDNPDRNSKSRYLSKVILQNIEVLAVGQEIGKASEAAATITNTVTLLVAPDDVPKLHLAESKGKLRLAMRGQGDSAMAKDSATTDNDLVGSGPAGIPTQKTSGHSLLAAFLSTQGKVASKQTDKDNQPVTSIAPAPSKSWTVELYKGPDTVESVEFEQTRDDQWQRVDGSAARPTAPARVAQAAAAPRSLFAPRPITASGTAGSTQQPQATGSATGGPTGTQ